LNPAANDLNVLKVARMTTLVSGVAATALAIVSPSVADTLTIFYVLLSVSMFVPVIAGLYVRRVGAPEAMAAAAAGVAIVVAMRLGNSGAWVLGLTPPMWGLAAAAVAALLVTLVRARPASGLEV
jgi:SSS family solute:Na+ symporter